MAPRPTTYLPRGEGCDTTVIPMTSARPLRIAILNDYEIVHPFSERTQMFMHGGLTVMLAISWVIAMILIPYFTLHYLGFIAFGLPGDNLTLSFHFPAGKEVYTKLVSWPGLTCFVTVDRGSGFSRVSGFGMGVGIELGQLPVNSAPPRLRHAGVWEMKVG